MGVSSTAPCVEVLFPSVLNFVTGFVIFALCVAVKAAGGGVKFSLLSMNVMLLSDQLFPSLALCFLETAVQLN